MTKIFDVEPGLPRSYTKGGTNSDRSRSDRRRVFNLLHGYTEDRGGIYVIRPNGSIRVKPPLPIDMVPEESSAILVESFYPNLNPSLIGKFEKLPRFGAGMTIGETVFRPEDGTEVNGGLNLIRNPEMPFSYDRHWEFLFKCARHISDVYDPVKNIHLAAQIARPAHDSTPDLIGRIDEILKGD